MAEHLIDLVTVLALAAVLAFAGLYLGYGNRWRSPAARALLVMTAGYALALVSLALHHPLALSVSDPVVAWLQFAATFASSCGTLALIWLLIKANGRWPWQR
jgi:hypothetical protein